MRIELARGKYTAVFDEKTGNLHALRYGEAWRDCIGDGFVLSLMQRIEALEAVHHAARAVTEDSMVMDSKVVQRLDEAITALDHSGTGAGT